MTDILSRKKIKVLVVDDSALVRKILTQELNARDGIEVIGTAPDPYVARQKIVELNPDVITLDIEMPRMDGVTFLRKLMAARPMPVIVLSSLAEENSDVVFESLQAGALEVVRKPGSSFSVRETCDELASLIRARAKTPVKVMAAPKESSGVRKPVMLSTTQKIIAIGASTGGVKSLTRLLSSLPATTPGILLCQHMPPRFTSIFAASLNEQCAMTVKEAEHGDRVLPGHVLLAPGDKHMRLKRSGASYHVTLDDGDKVCRQRPSVDVLFESVAQSAGVNAVGAILTGMGNDGAEGLLKMRECGARTMAQDEESSIIFGMPKEAINLGAAEQVVSLDHIPGALLECVNA